MPDILYGCKYVSNCDTPAIREIEIIDPPDDAREHMNIEDAIENLYFLKLRDASPDDRIQMIGKDSVNKLFANKCTTENGDPAIEIHGVFENPKTFLDKALGALYEMKKNTDERFSFIQKELGAINVGIENISAELKTQYPLIYRFDKTADSCKSRFVRARYIGDKSIEIEDSTIISVYDIDQTVFEENDIITMYLSQSNIDWFRTKVRDYNNEKISKLKETIAKLENDNAIMFGN